jgi:hypothetical protein
VAENPRGTLLLLAALALVPVPAVAGEPVDTAALAAEARSLSMQLGERLKAELLGAMQAGGPVAAIGVCRERALPLTAELGAQHGWKIGRTSLRVRNSANAPDDFERAVLADFNRRLAAGEPVAQLEDTSLDTRGNQREFRFVKAIPTAEPCTVCHGKDVAAPLRSALQEMYPEDAATGFAAGDIRGAFTLRKVLD